MLLGFIVATPIAAGVAMLIFEPEAIDYWPLKRQPVCERNVQAIGLALSWNKADSDGFYPPNIEAVVSKVDPLFNFFFFSVPAAYTVCPSTDTEPVADSDWDGTSQP